MSSNTACRTFVIVSLVLPLACNALLSNDKRQVITSESEGGASGGSKDASSDDASTMGGAAGSDLDSAGAAGVFAGGDAGMSGSAGSGEAGEAGHDAGMSGSAGAGKAGAGGGGTGGSGGATSCTGCTPKETRTVTRPCGCGTANQSGTETCSTSCKWGAAVWAGECTIKDSESGCSYVKFCRNGDGVTECVQVGCTKDDALAECRKDAALETVCGGINESLKMNYCR